MRDLDWLEQEWYDKLCSLGFGHDDAVLMAKIQADKNRQDWLEQEWYNKLRTIGCGHEEAVLLARIKANIERDQSLWDSIRKEGFNGFCRWIEIHCKDIYYYNIKGILQSAWNWLNRLF